jgi:adenylate kinase
MSVQLLLLGAPGSGKGTQAKILAERLGVRHIAPGDIFRREVRNGTELGRQVADIMSRGELVNDDLTVSIMGQEISSVDKSRGFILDGFPRNLAQAEALEGILQQLGIELDLVINLVVSDEKLLERGLNRRVCRKCGKPYNLAAAPPKVEGICDQCGSELVQRDDDREEAMLERFRVYREVTEPLVEYYRKQGILYVVDGEKPIDEVTTCILTEVERLGYRKSDDI